jgi:hypothetical protein
MSTFLWWRSWHGAPMDPKWPVIAARAGVKVGIVSAVAWALMDYASQHKDRGSIEGFDTEMYAVYSGFDEAEITAVIKAMTDKGVITNNHLTNWPKRQPLREDYSTPRVTKFREMKRNETQCNTEKENETIDSPLLSSLSLSDSLTGELESESPTDAFQDIQRAIESRGILPTGNDTNYINELVAANVTPDDVLAGIAWKADHNNGRPVYSVSQIIGPTKTEMSKRLQINGKKPEEHHYTEEY